MKKCFSCLLVLLALVLPGLVMEADAAEIVDSGNCGTYVTWSLDNEGTLMIRGSADMADYSYSSPAPWDENCSMVNTVVVEDGVTRIGECAFAYCANLTNVMIPESVTSLGNDAFANCSNLKNITIPHSVNIIGGDAFFGCSSLSDIIISYGVTSIGDNAFSGCSSLSGVDIPGSVTYIDSAAFAGCNKLTSIIIPDGITCINRATFWYCTSLECITIPGSVTTIDYDAFEGCDLTDVYYGGTAEQWDAIDIYDGNRGMLDANLHFDESLTDKETQPEEMPPVENPFIDVVESDYYYAPVLWAVNENITNGVDAAHFAPMDTCTRGQIVTFLWRANGSPEPKSGSNPFWDVHSSDYFYKAVLWAVENGITSGMGDGSFAPGAPCTRGQVATFLWRSEGQPDANAANSFYDVAPSEYYYDAVLWAVANGITNGMGDGTFTPDAPCTRGQIVTFLYRAEGFGLVEAPTSTQYTHNLVDRSYYNPAGLLRILYTYNKVEVLDQTQAAKEINARINKDVDVFFSRLTQEDLEEYAASPWLEAGGYFWYTAESEVTNNSDGVFSICVTTDWMMGGVHNLDYHGLSFDLKTGKAVDLAVLLGMSEYETSCKLKDIAWNYLCQQYGDGLFPDAYETLYAYTYGNFLYYFKDNELILTFPTYALGYGSSGAFTVPTGIYIP